MMPIAKRRQIAVVTGGRADMGILLPVMRAIAQEPALALNVLATGMHLSPAFGFTVQEIEKAGFSVQERIECLLPDDTPEAIAQAMGRGVCGFAEVFGRGRPDLLIVTGDRFEVHAAALAALPFKIPVAHLHGGELTQGAVDDALRHSLTKLSHLHFVSTEDYARRVRQLGEEPWRVIVSGAPSLDNLRTVELLPRQMLERTLGLRLEPAPLLVTFHPVTLEYEQTAWHAEQLLAALGRFGRPLVMTAPNADTSGQMIRQRLIAFVRSRQNAVLVESLGSQAYFGLMACAAAMVGNSSSGIIEAPSFWLPVVNIGSRQQGRVRARNVIDVGYDAEAIIQGIETALSASFRERLQGLANPYGEGHAAEVIVQRLKTLSLDQRLIRKHFCDARTITAWPERTEAVHAV